MTQERKMFTSFEKNDCPSDYIMFDDNSQAQVLGFSKIAITTEHSIFKILLVEYLDLRDWRRRPEGGEWEPIQIS
jgi:hypothetical protein